MKIINLKINFFKIITFILIILALLLLILAIDYFRNFIADEVSMTGENYTYILKDCHENLDRYLNRTISTTGYIYRNSDFDEEQFVIARDMIVKEPSDVRIVGFLCSSLKSKEFEANSWVKITGKITEGNYHGKIPIIKVSSILQVPKPENHLVLPPI